jgi:hypothetical protein
MNLIYHFDFNGLLLGKISDHRQIDAYREHFGLREFRRGAFPLLRAPTLLFLNHFQLSNRIILIIGRILWGLKAYPLKSFHWKSFRYPIFSVFSHKLTPWDPLSLFMNAIYTLLDDRLPGCTLSILTGEPALNALINWPISANKFDFIRYCICSLLSSQLFIIDGTQSV